MQAPREVAAALVIAVLLWPGAMGPPRGVAAQAVAAHRYVVFLDGREPSAGASGPTGVDRSRERFAAIRAQLEGLAQFAYFSYGAAAQYQVTGLYCLGWGVAGCSNPSGSLAALDLDPISRPEDSGLSLDLQAAALDWLVGQIMAQDPAAQIDLIGYSLGGVVAARWEALSAGSGASVGRVHALVLIDSPVGGVPMAGPVLEGCTLDTACELAEAVLAPLFGEIVLDELQPDGAGGIVPSLASAALGLDVTSIQSTNDYLVSGAALPLCPEACLTSFDVPLGAGSQGWPEHVLHEADLGGSPVLEPLEVGPALALVSANHEAPLGHPQTVAWVGEAFAVDGPRWRLAHQPGAPEVAVRAPPLPAPAGSAPVGPQRWTLALEADATQVSVGTSVTLTARSNRPEAESFAIAIRREGRGLSSSLVTTCQSQATCRAVVRSDQPSTWTYAASLYRCDEQGACVLDQEAAESNKVSITWR